MPANIAIYMFLLQNSSVIQASPQHMVLHSHSIMAVCMCDWTVLLLCGQEQPQTINFIHEVRLGFAGRVLGLNV